MIYSEKWAAAQARLAKLGVRDGDLEERFLKSSGSGGQNVNKVETAVTLIHRPSGIVLRCQEERSQWLNRCLARQRLAEKLEARAREKAASERHEKEKIRRKHRGRSASSKARMLKNKRFRASLKNARQPVRNDD
ncbi:MAG: peptide chain release factor family protein [Elusimicrobiota bacterium]